MVYKENKYSKLDLHMVHQVVGLLHLKSDFDVRYLHQLSRRTSEMYHVLD